MRIVKGGAAMRRPFDFVEYEGERISEDRWAKWT
jgi:hypothetical protein